MKEKELPKLELEVPEDNNLKTYLGEKTIYHYHIWKMKVNEER